jgi:hypothetical protein
MDALLDIDQMGRQIKAVLVSEVPEYSIISLCSALEAHQADPGIVSVILNTIGVIATFAGNLDAINRAGVMTRAMSLFRADPSMLTDPRVCEGFVSIVFHLSANAASVKVWLRWLC